jgi:hypothetical protein
MTEHGAALIVAAQFRNAIRSAADLGIQASVDLTGCGVAAGIATKIETAIRAEVPEFGQACMRASVLGDFGTEGRQFFQGSKAKGVK